MPHNKLDKKPAPVIFFNDGMGNRYTITAPVLLSIFQSKKLIDAYKQDPDRRYSVKDIFELRNKKIPIKESTVRRVLTENKVYFKTEKDIDLRGKNRSKTVMVINLTKFNPIVKYIFEAVEDMFNE